MSNWGDEFSSPFYDIYSKERIHTIEKDDIRKNIEIHFIRELKGKEHYGEI